MGRRADPAPSRAAPPRARPAAPARSRGRTAAAVVGLVLCLAVVAAWLGLRPQEPPADEPAVASKPKKAELTPVAARGDGVCTLRGSIGPGPAVRVYVHSERAEVDLDAALDPSGRSFSADLPEDGRVLVVAVAEDGSTAEASTTCAGGVASLALTWPKLPAGRATLSGRCFYVETGAPVAGAIVRGSREVGDGRRAAREASEPAFSGVADERGRFKIAAPAGAWLVSCAKDMDASEATSLVLSAGEERAVELAVAARASVVGRVLDADHNPVEGADVFGRSAGVGRASERVGERTDPAGTFRLRGLAPGPVVVEASSEGRFAEVEVFARAGLPYAEVTLVLAQGGLRIIGEVTSPEGEPLGGAVVEVEAMGGMHRSSRTPVTRRAIAAQDGRFSVGGLAPGRYRVSAKADGYAAATAVAEASTEPKDVKLVLQRACSASVVVVPASPPEPVRVRAERADGDHRMRRPILEVSGQTGEPIQLTGVAGSVTLVAETLGATGRAASVEADPCAANGPITLDLTAKGDRGAVEVEVVDKEERPLSGVEVEVTSGEVSAVTGADGRARLEGVEPGDQGVRADGGMPVGVKVEAGKTAHAKIVLDRARGEISGSVVANGRSVEGAALRAACGDNGQPRSLSDASVVARTDGAGSFTFAPKEGGVCLVRAEHPTQGSSEPVTLRVGGLPATIELQPLGAIEGRVIALATGAPVVGYTLTVKPIGRASDVDARVLYVSDAGGRFRVEGLSPGTLSVAVSAEKGKAQTEVSLPSGQQVRGIELSLFDRGQVVGRVVGPAGPVPGARVTVRRVVVGTRFGEMAIDGLGEAGAGPDGRFTVDVEAGDAFRVMVSAAGFYPWGSTPLSLDPLGRPLDLGDVTLSARASKDEKEGGIGIMFASDPHGVRVVQLTSDSPARDAGVQVGDVITAIDGVPAGRMPIVNWLVALRGPVGAPVALELERGTAPHFTVTVVRRAIGLPAVPEEP